MKSKLGVAAALAASTFLAACSDSTDPGDDIPVVDEIAAAAAPVAPTGTRVACYTNQTATVTSPTCPVIRWNDVTYWVFGYDDNRPSYNIAAYNEQNTRLMDFEVVGGRNVWQIDVDSDAETIVISGEGGTTVTVDWEELEISGGGL